MPDMNLMTMRNIKMGKTITIFSTKTLNEKNCLFECKWENQADGRHWVEIIDNDSSLIDFFSPSTHELIDLIKNHKTKLALLKDLLMSTVSNNPPPIDRDLKGYDELKQYNQDLTIGEAVRIFIENEIEGLVTDSELFSSLCERVNAWGLRKNLESLVESSDNNSKSKESKIVPTMVKSALYHIVGTGVFAVHCLEGKDKNNHNQWIPTLVSCATSLAGGEDFVLNLILHDKDLGDNTKYTEEDVLPLADADVKHLLNGFSVPLPSNMTKCHIIFFKHTTNVWVKILRTRYSSSRNLDDEIDVALRGCRELGILNNMSEANNQNNQAEFDRLRNEFLPDFPKCKVGSYETIRKLDERLCAVLEQLNNGYKS